MDWAQLDGVAVKLMKNRKEHRERERGFIYYHGRRVARSALELRRLVLPDDDSGDDALRLAGIFHDVGKGLSPHAAYGAAILPTAVQGLVPAELAQRAAEMIAHHCMRQVEPSPFDLWTQLLQDADLLDHSGCYGVWMNAQFYSVFDGCMTDGVQFHAQTSEKYYEDNVDLLNFAISKKIFRDKVNFEQEFFRRAALEAEGLFLGVSDDKEG